jgi:hypothetical protein
LLVRELADHGAAPAVSLLTQVRLESQDSGNLRHFLPFRIDL